MELSEPLVFEAFEPLVCEVHVDDLGNNVEVMERVPQAMAVLNQEQRGTPFVLLELLWEETGMAPEQVSFFKVVIGYCTPVVIWEPFRDQVCQILEHMHSDLHLMYTLEPVAA